MLHWVECLEVKCVNFEPGQNFPFKFGFMEGSFLDATAAGASGKNNSRLAASSRKWEPGFWNLSHLSLSQLNIRVIYVIL